MRQKTNPWKDLKDGDTLVGYYARVETQRVKVLKVLRSVDGEPMVQVEYPNRSQNVVPLSEFDHGERLENV